MNFRIMLAVTASLTIAACSGSKPADDAAKSAEATSEGAALASEAAPAAASAPAAGAAPTKEFMVGSWGTDGDCELAIGLKADGTMDGPFDGWKLEGNVLTMIGNPQTSTLKVVDDKTVSAKNNASGKNFKLTRC